MKWNQCVRCTKPVVIEQRVESPVQMVQFDTQEIVKEIRSLFEEHSSGKVSAPTEDDKNELTEEEVSEILSELIELSVGPFKEIPLNHELNRKFIWNIPRDIYETFKACKSEIIHPVFNPIVLLYIFCAYDPMSAYGLYLSILSDKLNHPGARYMIEESANEYRYTMNDVVSQSSSDEISDIDPDNYDDSYES